MPLSADRRTKFLLAPSFKRAFPVAADAVIYQGALVALDATGYLIPGEVDAAIISVGTAVQNVDNTGGDDGDLTCEVTTAAALFENSAGADEITIADIGSACYIVDDETVALTDDTGARSAAGTIHQVESAGVWVRPLGF